MSKYCVKYFDIAILCRYYI